MGDPASAAFLLKAGTSVAGGVSGLAQAKGEKQRAENNAYIGKTRAIQTSVAGAESLASELGTLRATFAANEQRPSVGNNAIFDRLRSVRGRETRIAVGNDMAASYDWQRSAKNARASGTSALLGGIGGAAVPVGDYLDRARQKALYPAAYPPYAGGLSLFDLFR